MLLTQCQRRPVLKEKVESGRVRAGMKGSATTSKARAQQQQALVTWVALEDATAAVKVEKIVIMGRPWNLLVSVVVVQWGV